MNKINLINGFYIRKLDVKNWVIAKAMKSKEGNEYESISGYYSTLKNAWNDSVDILALKQDNFDDIKTMIKDMKEIKFNLTNNE